jgi:hypothetical protein
MKRRDLSLALLGGIALGGFALEADAAPGKVSEKRALSALDPWADALFSGDHMRVKAILAPEFQILRSDGSGFGREDYIATLPVQKSRNVFSDIVATGTDNVLVIRYKVTSDQLIEGKRVQGTAPRLSVFRHSRQGWLMVAHANFAPIGR